MLIGIDASRAFGSERTGTENYSYHVITRMLQLPAAKKHTFVLFTRPNVVIPDELVGCNNLIVREIGLKYLWTQWGLARETWRQFRVVNPKLQTLNPKQIQNSNLETDKKYNLDVLWVPAHTLPILRNPRVKTVVTIHGLEYRWLPEYRNWLQRWYLPLSTFYAAKAADRLICVSEATKQDLLSEILIDPEKISVIWEGTTFSSIPVSQYPSKTWEKYGLEKGKYVLFVGTVQPRKNLGALIKAFAQFYLSHPGYRLVIAGSVGWQAEADLQLPEGLGIPEAVIFTGRISQTELQVLYLGAAIYVQPSWTEGFGLPVLEAMKASVPVIASDGGALPEVVGEAGVIVGLGNPKSKILNSKQFQNQKPAKGFENDLAEAMARVVTDKQLSAQLRRKGQVRASELTWDETAKETLKALLATGRNG